MPLHNFCLRRQVLYKRYLDETAKFFSDLGTQRERPVRLQRHGTRGELADQSLIDALEEIHPAAGKVTCVEGRQP